MLRFVARDADDIIRHQPCPLLSQNLAICEATHNTPLIRKMKMKRQCFVSLLLLLSSQAFVPGLNHIQLRRWQTGSKPLGYVCNRPTRSALSVQPKPDTPCSSNNKSNMGSATLFNHALFESIGRTITATVLALSLTFTSLPTPYTTLEPAMAADGATIASCLLKKCPLPLAKCIANPMCLANVICINSCNGKADEIGCQLACGNLFENDVVGEFNKCALTEMDCVPQRKDDGSYPIPPPQVLVRDFDTKLWNGKWYITAGQNELFDTFPCQVHFFTETAPGKFFGKINWRIAEPDGEYFTREALQRFVQDPQQPGHLINHNNEYLHYEDDWYVIDYAYDDNKEGVPPFAFIYYRGSNDAWVGYGGAVVYTRDSTLPKELLPRLRAAAKKVKFDFDKDFKITDNTCKSITDGEALLLKEKFAGKVFLQSEKQLQAAAVNAARSSVNTLKAQELFMSDELGQAQKAVEELSSRAKNFEQDIAKKVEVIEEVLVDEVVEIVKDVEKIIQDVDAREDINK